MLGRFLFSYMSFNGVWARGHVCLRTICRFEMCICQNTARDGGQAIGYELCKVEAGSQDVNAVSSKAKSVVGSVRPLYQRVTPTRWSHFDQRLRSDFWGKMPGLGK